MTNDHRLSISELAKLSGTTVRTIRYYVAEGLLPQPAEKGSYGYYNQNHLDRLELIATLKDRRMSLAEINHFIESMSEQELKKILETAREIGVAPIVHESALLLNRIEDNSQVVQRRHRSNYPPDVQAMSVAGAPSPGEDEVLDQLAASALSSGSEVPGDDHWIRKELVEGVELHYKAGASEGMQIAIDNIVASGRSGLTEQRNREKSPGSKKRSRFFHRKPKRGEK